MTPHQHAFLSSCRARRLSPKTTTAYEWALDKLPPEPIAAEDLERALTTTRLSHESTWDLWRFWRTYFRWRERRLQIPNPMATLDPPKHTTPPPHTLTWPQLQRLQLTTANPLHKALVLLILDTGLRLGEIADLTPESLKPMPTTDTPDGLVLAVHGKTGYRAVPISPTIAQLVRPHLPWGLTPNGIAIAIRRLLARAGIKGGPHTLRHSYALNAYLKGGDQRHVQGMLGHTSAAMTQRYVNIAVEHLIQKQRTTSPALALLNDPTQQTKRRRTK